MKGPLDPSMYDTGRWPDSWWRASAPPWEGPAPLDGDTQAEVAIIGGGYAGLACAIRLAERGIGALVLDAGPIGWGASGRNGGMVGLGSHKLSMAALVRRHGATEVDRYRASQVEGNARLRAFCEARGLPVQGRGEMLLAHSASAFRELASRKPPPGGGYEVIEPRPAGNGAGDMARFGGLLLKPYFGVQPLRLVRAMADRAVELGVRVHPRSEVATWRREGGRHRLATPRGTVSAARVVLATNGFTPDGLHPAFDGRAVPVISNIGVTRVLTPEERARHAWLQDDPVADTRHLLVYLRMLPEGRLMFGMRGDVTGSDEGARVMRARLERRIGEQFPGWKGVPLDHFWRGPICATASYTPAVGRLAGDASVFHAFGWHGSGVNGAQVGARLLADVIAGAPLESIPSPWRGGAPRLPAPGLRPLYVGLALAQQRLADALS